jgi:hypothetical protein
MRLTDRLLHEQDVAEIISGRIFFAPPFESSVATELNEAR